MRRDHRGAVLVLVAVLGTALLVTFGSVAEHWIDYRRDLGLAQTFETGALKQLEAASEQPDEKLIVPPPDPDLANAPLRGDPGRAFRADAYPPEALRRGEQGRTVAELEVDASGTPVGCRIRKSSGSRSLDSATCFGALRRARYIPARDARGVAIPAIAVLPVRWQIPQ